MLNCSYWSISECSALDLMDRQYSEKKNLKLNSFKNVLYYEKQKNKRISKKIRFFEL